MKTIRHFSLSKNFYLPTGCIFYFEEILKKKEPYFS
jgi:hypothetical protein